jgi:predicted ABC-type ATPase
MYPLLDARPIMIAIAGPNGAGKTTFFSAFLRQAGLRFVNAAEIAYELGLNPYEAAKVAEFQRGERRMLGKPIPPWLMSAIP